MTSILRRSSTLTLAFVAALALAAWVSAGDARADDPAGMHPGVEAFAETHPGARIPVIFRTDGSADHLATEVTAEGATEVYALDMIGGVAASVTADQLDRLSHDDDVEWVALDAEMASAGKGESERERDFRGIKTAYPFAAGAPGAWSAGVTGDGVTVAVIDSGISEHSDFQGRAHVCFDMSSVSNGVRDRNGHGTYVAGIIGGRGKGYVGIAPRANLLSLRVSGDDGSALASDVVAALEWAVDHKDEYGIRVVNISLTSTVPDSYKQDPLDAAVEQAWFRGIVVVVSAGNYGTDAFSADHAPANDPYVITVGAFNDMGTADGSDDQLASWSSRGGTADGYAKPDVVAPGIGVTSTLARNSNFAKEHGSSVIDRQYITLDGTSASAAVVSGSVALMLQDEPGLTPDQVKFRLMHSGANLSGSAAPKVDAGAAVASTVTDGANGNGVPNDLIDPETGDIIYDSVLWRSVLWRSVLWRSVGGAVLWRN